MWKVSSVKKPSAEVVLVGRDDRRKTRTTGRNTGKGLVTQFNWG
jgi:hypothetical protein